MLDAALADDGLIDPADVRRSGLRRDFDMYLHADFTVGVNARRYVHIHAYVEVLKLGVYQRVHDARSGAGRTDADAGLEAAGGHGDTIADLELGGLSIHHTNFRIVED